MILFCFCFLNNWFEIEEKNLHFNYFVHSEYFAVTKWKKTKDDPICWTINVQKKKLEKIILYSPNQILLIFIFILSNAFYCWYFCLYIWFFAMWKSVLLIFSTYLDTVLSQKTKRIYCRYYYDLAHFIYSLMIQKQLKILWISLIECSKWANMYQQLAPSFHW